MSGYTMIVMTGNHAKSCLVMKKFFRKAKFQESVITEAVCYVS
jgi:hypothetical protein